MFEGWQFPRFVREFQRFRKFLFVERLGWLLHCEGDREEDEFDTQRTVYCLLHQAGRLVGGWRAIRTTEDYLGLKLFPQLATLRPYPLRRDVWEISRLAVHPESAPIVAARCTYALMVHFARTRDAASLIGVVDLVHGRKIGVAGLRLRRLGAPQSIGTDVRGREIHAYVAELRLGEQAGECFSRLMAHLNFLEITDAAAAVSGADRVSA
jgi:N-acyl-L-homoserine lactone synthetase